MRRLNRILSTVASHSELLGLRRKHMFLPFFLRAEGMRGNPKNVCVGGYRYIHKISECEVMKLVRPCLCAVYLLVLSSVYTSVFVYYL